MNEQRHANIPAFPTAESHSIAADFTWTQGMSLRDYFAAKALLADNMADGLFNSSSFDVIAKRAYLMADAMLAERNK